MTTTKEIQLALLKAGYSVGMSGADGINGRNTIAAITKYQTNRKLNVSNYGVVDSITLISLGFLGSSSLVPPWVTLGKSKMGLIETRDNKQLEMFLKSDGHTLGDPSKLPWCGDFMETIIALTLPKEPMIVNPYWAANWQKFGVHVPDGKYYLGAIGVKSRVGGNHVFTLVGHDKDYVHALGGNQSNSISVAKIAKSDINEMRFPSTYTFPTQEMPYEVFNGKVNVSEA